MHVEHAVTLLLFALGAFLVPLGSSRVGLPAAVGEILYGIVVGPQLAGLVHLDPFTTVLAELGFCFLMFLVGLELDFAHLERVGRRTIGICAAVAVSIFVAAFGGAWLLGLPRFLVLVLGAMSVGILLATLGLDAAVSPASHPRPAASGRGSGPGQPQGGQLPGPGATDGLRLWHVGDLPGAPSPDRGHGCRRAKRSNASRLH